jgi:FkbM family methyltransferase
MDNFYQSQYNQDRFLNERYFKNKVGGVFVDIGSHDGKTLSNTYFYEKALNWSGLCIEPHPKVFEQLKENRSCILVEGCAWHEDTTKIFRVIEGYSEMLSGLVEAYPEAHRQRVETEVTSMNQKVEDVEMRCYDINRLLTDNGINKIDLVSIDVEGSELSILRAIDYNKVSIRVILVENNYNDEELRTFLKEKGFDLEDRYSIDDVFVNKNFDAN